VDIGDDVAPAPDFAEAEVPETAGVVPEAAEAAATDKAEARPAAAGAAVEDGADRASTAAAHTVPPPPPASELQSILRLLQTSDHLGPIVLFDSVMSPKLKYDYCVFFEPRKASAAWSEVLRELPEILTDVLGSSAMRQHLAQALLSQLNIPGCSQWYTCLSLVSSAMYAT